jgi:hypothetical protein
MAQLAAGSTRSGMTHRRQIGVWLKRPFEQPALNAKLSFPLHFISAGMSPNNGVLRYRSPVSGSMQSTVPPFGASAHTRKAPANVAPAVMPTKIPSFCAKSRLQRSASALGMGMIRSMTCISTASAVSFGMKSGVLSGDPVIQSLASKIRNNFARGGARVHVGVSLVFKLAS